MKYFVKYDRLIRENKKLYLHLCGGVFFYNKGAWHHWQKESLIEICKLEQEG